MPGIPLVTRETVNCGCSCNYSTGIDHMCRHDRRERMSPEEQIAAEESLSVYCKPVELYNILQRRAVENPSFLQRCLRYKLEAKHKKRIEMSISLPSAVNDESGIQSLLPLCILIAKPVYTPQGVENSAVYRFSRESILTGCLGIERKKQDQAKFILPDIKKLSEEVKSCSLSILFVSCADLFKEDIEASFSANATGPCLLGKIPLEVVHLSWEKSPNLSNGDRAEMLSTVDLRSCVLEAGYFGADKCFSFQNPNTGAMEKSLQLQVSIVAQELGAKDISPYDSFSYSGIPLSTLPQIIRLRTGNVIFSYRYHNNELQRTEVTEDFTCSFCLVKCASFKGLRFHLLACHDLFNFEFWVTEEFQAVNVSVRSDIWRSEIVAAGVDPQQQTFSFCSKSLRRRKRKSISRRSNHALPLVIESELPGSTNVNQEKTDENGGRDASSPRISSATANSYADPECLHPVTESSIPSLVQPSTKSRKLSTEREPRNRALLLKKRQFFHSHRAQPMAMEQVLSDRDSEDEVDDDVADLEDRRMLDDFVDVTDDEKGMMHLWNSFVRKQRVLADGHVPWACEAFSKLHGQDFVQNPALLWCWRLFMVKLWNHGLLDPRTMNNCNIIIEGFQKKGTDP